MAALLTDQFRIFSARKFIKALEGPIATQSDDLAGATRDRLYLFIGRPQTWDNETLHLKQLILSKSSLVHMMT